MQKTLRAKWIAPETHALLFICMWIFYSLFSQPIAEGPSGVLFVILFAADLPISFPAFVVLFTSSRYGALAVLLWGILGTLWWFLIGYAIDAGISRFRERRASEMSHGASIISDSKAGNPRRGELLISTAIVSVIVITTLGWEWNGAQGHFDKSKIGSLTFAPDNRSISLVRSTGNSSDIENVGVVTGSSIPIKKAIPCEASSLEYSPDSRQIAFACRSTANDSSRILVMNSDGGNLRPLPFSSPDEYEFAPHFAADGEELYFAKAAPSEPIAGGQPIRQSWDLYSARLDGKNVHAVTERYFNLFGISFSQEGGKIVVWGEATTGTQVFLYSLDYFEKDATAIRPLIPTVTQPSEISNVTLAPDGQHIYFMAATDGKKGFDYDVYRTDITGNNVEKLTSANGYATDLCLSPDGKTAAFLRWTSRWGSFPNLSRLYKLDLSSKSVTPLEVTGTE